MKLSDFATLAEAKAYEQTRGQLVSRHVMNAILAQAGLYVPLRKMQDDDANPFQNAMAAFFDAGISEYNFQSAHPIGSQNLAMLDAMIAADIGGLGTALSAVRTQLVAMSEITVNPYSGTTLHEWNLAKETMTRKEVTPVNGWLQVTYTQDVERHAPNLWIYHADIDFWERVGGLGIVEAARTYTIRSPRNQPMLIDNAYNAIA